MEKIGATFLITGEVLGQRPMSQMRRSMNIIEKESDLTGKILRPLSAKLLELTHPEIEGVVDREKLLDLQGRSRKDQIRLAEQFGLKDYPTPAGGCLLTDENFAVKVKDYFAHSDVNSTEDFELLTLGRHSRMDHQTKIIVGRNERENLTLQWYAQKENRHLLIPKNFIGPFVLIVGPLTEESKRKASDLAVQYTRQDRRPVDKVIFEYRDQVIEILLSETVPCSL
jgi:tRNA U34 2-thiouridine synthase MnmA/TrmU